MPKDTRPHLPDPVPDRALGPFLGLSFGLAWGIFALFALFPGPITALMGAPSAAHPLFILAVWAPAIAAFALVWRHAGRAGLGRFLARLLLWRMPGLWWAILILGVPLVYMAGAAAMGRPLLAPAESAGALLAAMAFMGVLGPVEEFGWRGLMLPVLQRRMAPVWAGLVTGVVWGLWHLPAFFLGGTPQSGWDFTPFFAGAVGASLIVTAMFNASKGSLLVAMLFHYSLNLPLWPDGQPWDMWLFAGAGLLTVLLCRRRMFALQGAVTEVVPPASSG
jgi:membrane protease YdiL (CAAX protease family)